MTDLIKIADVPEYIYIRTSKRVSRQTVYRWIIKGKTLHGVAVRLQSKTVLGQRYCTQEHINNFLSRVKT